MIRTCAITLDIHTTDTPDDIREAHVVLAERGFVATYFVPTSLLEDARFREALRMLDDSRFEIGTHSHCHNLSEVVALSSESEGALEFLKRSVYVYEDFFGRRPTSFRSPSWCWLSERTLDTLADLGYQVDSSSTPQRIGLFSSYPFDNHCLLSPRKPAFVRPGLLEVPTSSFIIPFGRLSLAAFRKWGGLAFASGFCVEAILTGHVVTIQLHPKDFVPGGERPMKRWSFKDFVPIRGQGFGVRHWILDEDPGRMTDRVLAVLDLFRRVGLEPMTLSSIYNRMVGNMPRRESQTGIGQGGDNRVDPRFHERREDLPNKDCKSRKGRAANGACDGRCQDSVKARKPGEAAR